MIKRAITRESERELMPSHGHIFHLAASSTSLPSTSSTYFSFLCLCQVSLLLFCSPGERKLFLVLALMIFPWKSGGWPKQLFGSDWISEDRDSFNWLLFTYNKKNNWTLLTSTSTYLRKLIVWSFDKQLTLAVSENNSKDNDASCMTVYSCQFVVLWEI